MKNTTKALILAGAFAAASAANAQVAIYLTGSTAFRAETFTALKALYGGSPTLTPANAAGSSSKVTYVGNGGNIGTLFGGQTVTIKTAFSGSVEGVVNVLGAANPSGVSQPTYLNADGSTDSNVNADFAFSDVYQDTTDYPSGDFGTLDDYPAGVVCFAWTRNLAAAATGLDNITSQMASQIFSDGNLKKSVFTGSLSDTNTPVYVTGRYSLSGTRLVYSADCGFGAGTPATFYVITNSLPVLDGLGGRTGGGDVKGVLNENTTTAAFIGTLGTSDSSGVAGGANRLTYNGVPFSQANVRSGKYSLWSYEHLFVRPGTSTTKLKLVKGTTVPAKPVNSNGLINAVDTALSTSVNNVQLSTMKAARNADGGPIFYQP